MDFSAEQDLKNHLLNNNDELKKKLKITIWFLVILFFIFIIMAIIVVAVREKNSDHLIIEPRSGKHTHTIIFLPGLSEKPENFEDLFSKNLTFKNQNNTKIIILHSSSITLSYDGNETFSWFDIHSLPINSSECYSYEGMKNSSDILKDFIEEEAKILKGKYSKIIIGGNNIGAMVSLYTGFKVIKEKLGGIFSINGILPEKDDILPGKEDLQVLYAYEENNIFIQSDNSDNIKKKLNVSDVEFKTYTNSDIDIKKIEDLEQFLNRTLI